MAPGSTRAARRPTRRSASLVPGAGTGTVTGAGTVTEPAARGTGRRGAPGGPRAATSLNSSLTSTIFPARTSEGDLDDGGNLPGAGLTPRPRRRTARPLKWSGWTKSTVVPVSCQVGAVRGAAHRLLARQEQQGFVHEQYSWLGGRRNDPRDSCPLAHTARQIGRQTVEHATQDRAPGALRWHPPPLSVAKAAKASRPVEFEGQSHVALGTVATEGGRGPGTQADSLRTTGTVDVLAEDGNVALVGPD